ncbi:hypothetical protein SLE2022_237870 [Rubroshorea leprosula]
MTEGKIVSWAKSEGDKLSKGESVVVVESDKADMDVETFYDGFLAAIVVKEGCVAPVGSASALLAETVDEIAVAKPKASSSGVASTSQEPQRKQKADGEVVAPATAAPTVSSLKAADLGSAVHPALEGEKRIVASPYAEKLAKEL